jgi:hypothetical protein
MRRRRLWIGLASLALGATLLGQGFAETPDETQPAAIPAASPARGTLTLQPGTWITVRMDQELSSDHSYPGDAFTATLAQALIADGIVVARRGQTVGGRVVEAVKAGKAKGTSRLSVELSELSLVDGRQVPVRTRFMEYQAGTSVGRDAGAVATTTGVGAAIGAAADGGFGAGMGAIAGAAAGLVGVLSTRGRATVIYPESQVTFRLEEPLAVSTESAPHAFRPATADDYEQRTLNRQRAQAPARRPYYDPWGWYGPYYYPRFIYGPSLHFYSGPRRHGRWGWFGGIW